MINKYVKRIAFTLVVIFLDLIFSTVDNVKDIWLYGGVDNQPWKFWQ